MAWSTTCSGRCRGSRSSRRAAALVDAVSDGGAAVTGVTPALSTSGGTSDGRFLATVAREVVEFGPLSASIHGIDEHVAVADIAPLSVIYERVARTLLGLWRKKRAGLNRLQKKPAT